MRKILFEEKMPVDPAWVVGVALLAFPATIIAIILFQSQDSIFFFKATIFSILTIIVSATVLFFIQRKIKLRSNELVIQRGPIITAIPLNKIIEVHELSNKKSFSLKEQIIMISNFENKSNIKVIWKNNNYKNKISKTEFYCQLN